MRDYETVSLMNRGKATEHMGRRIVDVPAIAESGAPTEPAWC
jgi:hypothetical protein